MKLINRKDALDKLRSLKRSDVIKVITGVRRCGKSTLLQTFYNELLDNGADQKHFISINFEDPKYEKYKSWRTLYDFVKEQADHQHYLYVFLDEVQEVSEFQKVVNAINLLKNVDLYITGSNSHLLSGELATLLTGRYIEIHLTPLLFSEYLQFVQTDRSDLKLIDFLNFGGLPGSLPLFEISQNAGEDYLRSIYDTILYRDIAARLNLRNLQLFERLSSFMIDTVGSENSVNSITNRLKNMGYILSNNTIDEYLHQLKNAYILYEVNRHDLKGKKILNTCKKRYVVDLGFKRIATFKSSISDIGHKLENAVYFELRRRYPRVYIGKVGEYEIDFVCESYNNRLFHYQVAASVRDIATLARELRPLRKISNSSGKFIITFDDYERVEEGVEIVTAHKWFNTSLE
jgi:predicted AAA+ superfamily ATPase